MAAAASAPSTSRSSWSRPAGSCCRCRWWKRPRPHGRLSHGRVGRRVSVGNTSRSAGGDARDRSGHHGSVLELWRWPRVRVFRRRSASSLSGTIPFVAFARSADAFLVAVESRPAAVVCVVPRDASGITATASRNVDGSASSTLVFDRVLRREVYCDRSARRDKLTLEMQEFLALGAARRAHRARGRARSTSPSTTSSCASSSGGRSAASRCCSIARSTASSTSSSTARCVYRVLAAFDAGEHHPAMVSAVKARASRCALADHSRRAADARRHRLHRGA